MPYIGLSSFLQEYEVTYVNDRGCVNALYRAFFISTADRLWQRFVFHILCQCPISGVLHFYDNGRKVFLELRKSVNALYRAFFISTANCRK